MRAVLTDIEGTTTAISFVHDVLFPYARVRLAGWVAQKWDDPALADTWRAVEAEAGVTGRESTLQVLLQWMDEDRKATSLKALQGQIWAAGYADGALVSHVYPDVAPALRAWRDAGLTLAVYSSGSVQAQQLLYGHSVAGDLRPLFSAWFDTRVGPKRAPTSYAAIAAALRLPPAEILFLSDIVEELDAAAAAGLRTCWIWRDAPSPGHAPHPCAENFTQVMV